MSIVASLELFPSQTYAFSTPQTVGFAASLNSTAIAQNQTLGVTLTDTNYLPFPNAPPVYGLPDNVSESRCGFSYPFGANAYQGRYTQSNISSAKVLDVFNVFGFYSCPVISIVPYRLGPLQSVTRQMDISGYWNSGETPEPGGFSEGVLYPFPPGTYTLLVADAWGHTEFLYFQVTGPTSVSSGINGLGLELTASLPTILASGQALSVTAQVNNTTPQVLNLTATSMVNHANGPCPQGQVIGIEVYSGSYTYLELFNNGSQPTPLQLYNPSLSYLCPAVFSFNYVFKPDGVNATVRTYLGGNQITKDQVKAVEETSTVSGYWIQSGTTYVLHHFDLGVYTVVVFDYWGNKAIGYFQVT